MIGGLDRGHAGQGYLGYLKQWGELEFFFFESEFVFRSAYRGGHMCKEAKLESARPDWPAGDERATPARLHDARGSTEVPPHRSRN